MNHKVGDTVLLCSSTDAPDSLREAVIGSIHGSGATATFIPVGGTKEDHFYLAYAWPVRVREELVTVLKHRAALKKAYEDSFGLVLELGNKITRGEL